MHSPCRRLSLSCCSYIFILLLFITASAQQDQTPKRGFQAGGSYALSDIETINTGSGNVILNIPMASLPGGRGTAPGSTLRLLYNSKMFDSRVEHYTGLPEGGGDCISPSGISIPCDQSRNNRDRNRPYLNAAFQPQSNNLNYSMNVLQASEEGGWRYGLGYKLQFFKREDEYVGPSTPNCPADEAVYIFKLKMAFPDGGVHEFRPTGYSQSSTLNDGYYRINYDGWLRDCANIGYYAVTGGMTYYSTDGSYLRLFIAHDGDNNPYNNAWTLYMPDGSRITGGSGPQRVYDRNNNYTEIQLVTLSNGHTAHKVVDQLGRYFLIEYGAAVNEDNVVMYGVGGEEIRWRIKWKGVWVHKNYISTDDQLPMGVSRIKEVMTQFYVVDQVILPAQAGSLSYSFNYNGSATQPAWDSYTNGWGEVNAVTLPSGAQSSYQYTMEQGTGSYLDVLKNGPTRKDLSYQKEYDNDISVATETWLYSLSPGASFITNPDGGVSKEYFLQTGQTYASESPGGTVVERIWLSNFPENLYVKTEFTSIRDAGGNLTKTAIKDYNYDKNGNVTAVREYDWVAYASVPRSSGSPTGLPGGLTPKRVTTNTYYNPTPDASDINTYDPDNYALATAPQIKNAISSSEVSNGSQVVSRSEFIYDNATTTGNLTQQKSWDSTKGGYSNPLGGNSISVSTQYNQYGGPILTTDSRGNQTQVIYGSVAGNTDLYPTQIKTAYQTSLQRTEQREYDFTTGLVTRATDADNNVSSSTVYDAFGRPTLVRAAENKPEETRTATEYSDVNRRVIVRSDLNTVGDAKLVSIQHYDRLGRVRLTRQLENSSEDPTLETTGIKVQTRYVFSGANSYQVVSNPYRATSVAGASSESTMGWSRTRSDLGGRVIEMQTFGGNTLPSPWGANATSTGMVATVYNAETTTVTDQDNKARRSVIDGLGRLASVVEDPSQLNYVTNYSYDALDSLTLVNQGVQTRTFVYDSLKRLSSASNPESGTITYQYDNGGNLLVKTDARNVSAHYSYDALGRVTRRWYNSSSSQTATANNSPALPAQIGASDEATYNYDPAIANGKGRLASVSSSASSYTYNVYDAMGRPKNGTQSIGSQNYPLSYVYDLAGHVKSTTYPSERAVNYTFDTAGRLLTFTGNLGDGAQRNYATGTVYAPTGGLSQEQFGTTTAIFNKLLYNSRGQLAEIREGVTPNDTNWERGAIVNNYSTQCGGICWANGSSSAMSDNNGNLRKQEVYVPGAASFAQFYEYDRLNRLESVRESRANGPVNWQQAYAYDRFGNRSINQGGTSQGVGINSMHASVILPDTTTNRLYAAGESEQNHPTMNYDAAGNQTKDYYSDSASGMNHDHIYDAENRLKISTTTYTSPASTQVSTYSYDADGRRVRRNVGGVETWYAYGISGELVAEYAANTNAASAQKEYGYRNGQLLITAEPGARTNVAAATNGGVATASSQESPYTTNYINDSERLGYVSAHYSFWRDATNSAWPDWAQIDFNGNKTIDEIDVFTVQDNAETPAEPTESLTFSLHGITAFDVQYWNGTSWVTVTGGSISGNNKVWKKLNFTAVTTSKIRVTVNSALNSRSRIVELEAWGTAAATAALNVASASNGGTATAQNYTQDGVFPNMHFQPAYANDGTRYIHGPGGDQFWRDEHGLSSWLQIDFNGAKAITEVDVYTIDGSTAQSDPTATQTFSSLGASAYEVQYWTGSAWAAVPGGTVSGNNLVWKKLTFASITTAKIRVVVSAASDSVARIAEVEAWTAGSGGSTANINWLVTDQLGTPRLVFDQTGALATTKRHDYLPFGEELSSGQGGRTPTLGYSLDSIRQKFTDKERDIETGLDYFGARYYAALQGRFTSADPLTIKKERLLDPQRINLYVYARNNPSKFIDPNGADLVLAEGLTAKQREFIVYHMARLYMTEKGRASLERADRSQYKVEVGKGNLPRTEINPSKPMETKFGGSIFVVAGNTNYNLTTVPSTNEKQLSASGPAGLELLKPISVTIDRSNTADLGKDPAGVMQHEIGGHVNSVLELADRPYAGTEYPAGRITELANTKDDEKNAQRVEKELRRIPEKPSVEAIKAVEQMLAPKKNE
jgi:RHS repeat-associated protein